MELSRIRDRTGQRRSGGREAAVLVPVISRDPGEHLVFTKRADDLTEHPGQMSFPGGGREPEDPDLFATATREADEEIGLPPERVRPIGELDDITTTSEYVVRPFVARIPDHPFTPHGAEVAEIAVLPVAEFLDPTNYDYEMRRTPQGETLPVHEFTVDGYRIWGATGLLVVQLLELTTDWRADAVRD